MKKIIPLFLLLGLCAAPFINSDISKACSQTDINVKEVNTNDESTTALGVIGDTHVLIDKTFETALNDEEKAELLYYTATILEQKNIENISNDISIMSTVGPKNVLQSHTCSPTAPYMPDKYYGSVLLENSKGVIYGQIDYYHCGQSSKCKYLGAVTTIY